MRETEEAKQQEEDATPREEGHEPVPPANQVQDNAGGREEEADADHQDLISCDVAAEERTPSHQHSTHDSEEASYEEDADDATDVAEEAEAVETLTEAVLARRSEATEHEVEHNTLENFISRSQQPEEDGAMTGIEELTTHHHRTHKQREADAWLRSTKITSHTDVGFYIAKMIAQRGLRSKVSKASLQDSFELNMGVLAEAKEDAGLDEDAKRLRSLNFNTALRHFVKAGEVQLRRVGE